MVKMRALRPVLSPCLPGAGIANTILTKALKAGLKIYEGGKLVNSVTKAGITVIGHNPKYVELAKKLGANVFDIPWKIWEKMSPAEQLVANLKFLDRAIARGDEFLLATPLRDGPSMFRTEIKYILEHGYIYSSDGTRFNSRNSIKFMSTNDEDLKEFEESVSDVLDYFSFLMQEHGFQIYEKDYDEAHFGNFVVVLKGDFFVRFVRDRGQIFADVKPLNTRDEWFDLRNVLEFLKDEKVSFTSAGAKELGFHLKENFEDVKNVLLNNYDLLIVKLKRF